MSYLSTESKREGRDGSKFKGSQRKRTSLRPRCKFIVGKKLLQRRPQKGKNTRRTGLQEIQRNGGTEHSRKESKEEGSSREKVGKKGV